MSQEMPQTRSRFWFVDRRRQNLAVLYEVYEPLQSLTGSSKEVARTVFGGREASRNGRDLQITQIPVFATDPAKAGSASTTCSLHILLT